MTGIIELINRIEKIVISHEELIGEEASELKQELSIESAETVQKALDEIKAQNRSLKIGIVGRVKAGKSSLLNALLFDGNDILPKAATPMTAALTRISYGDELSVEVELFTKKDIQNIKNKHDKYEEKLDQEKERIKTELVEKRKRKRKPKLATNKQSDTDLEEIAKKRAIRRLKEDKILVSAYDQYKKIKASGIADSIDDIKKITATDINQLNEKLLDYVGSEGKYMPFTKSAHIRLPQDNLKQLEIIDTPGVNDPVQSREDRTRELLKFCDVIFIVSPSGQFMSNEDIDLMDRITTKEGVQELYVISSQIDNQLMGSEKSENKGQLPKVLSSITSRLGKHLSSTLNQLKKSNPEIGCTFDSLIKQGSERVIHSSGICQTIISQFNNKERWSDGTKKVWENLCHNYPDYFTDTDQSLSLANLKTLSNVDKLKELFDEVKNKKENILAKRQQDFITAKKQSLEKYVAELLVDAKEKSKTLQKIDTQTLKEQKIQLEKIQAKSRENLIDTYEDLVVGYGLDVVKELNKKLNFYYRELEEGVSEAKKSESESYEVSASSWYNPFSWGSSETRTRTFATIRSGAVRSGISDFTNNIKSGLFDSAERTKILFKKTLNSKLLETLRRHSNDDDIDISVLQKSIRKVLNTIIFPDLEYKSQLPESLAAKGKLKDYEAEQFLEDAKDYISDFKNTVSKGLRKYSKELTNKLKEHDLSAEIFSSYNMRVADLEKQLKDKENTLEQLNSLIKKLQVVYER